MGAGIGFHMATATLRPTSVTKTFKFFPLNQTKLKPIIYPGWSFEIIKWLLSPYMALRYLYCYC